MSGTTEEQVCPECGAAFQPKRRGRPSVYCRPACRQRAWALRQAAARLVERGHQIADPPAAAGAAHARGAATLTGPADSPDPATSAGTTGAVTPEPTAGEHTANPVFGPPAAPGPSVTSVPASVAAAASRAVGELPTDARGWSRALVGLAAQLSDPGSVLSRQPWEHLRVYDALSRALTALDAGTPGGLAWLERHES